MTSFSAFTITPSDAAMLVKNSRSKTFESEDNRHCYLVQVSFQPVYGSGQLSPSCIKKLPRLINGIPLGAGRLTQNEARQIVWRYVDNGSRDLHVFLSTPLLWQDADEARQLLRDNLVRLSKTVFGDVTVKTSLFLSQCLHFDADLFINDIAEPLLEGLHFKD